MRPRSPKASRRPRSLLCTDKGPTATHTHVCLARPHRTFRAHFAACTGAYQQCVADGVLMPQHAASSRHLSVQAAAQEAVICWSAPPPWHPVAEPFVNHSLNRMFGKDSSGKQKEWNFTHKREMISIMACLHDVGTSQEVGRLKKVQPRLPAGFYQ